jgi:tRNA nucleotidyltransferase (CCA-adding enzyme)
MKDPSLLERLRALPCGQQLLKAVAGRDGVHLVGGAVRDLLLGREPRELDVVVEGELDALATALGPAATTHGRFGTATVQRGDCRWDLALARAEHYARPGALPVVRAAGIDEDLRRRDVTVNAIALDLSSGQLRAVEGARADLLTRRLRVLHDASFIDDPTRLWRIARYSARLGFELEERTARLAAQAVGAGALATVSGARIGNELRLALQEPDPLAALGAAAQLGLVPWMVADPDRVRAALELLPSGEGRPDLLVLGASLAVAEGEAEALLAELQFSVAERAVVRACAQAPALALAARNAATRASALARVLRGVPVEAVALAGAHGAQDAARRWLKELRDVELAIDGDDLLAAGVPEGPQIGSLLAATLDRRLDGQLGPERDAQLQAALQARDSRHTRSRSGQ